MNQAAFDLYGSNSPDIAAVSRAVGATLSMTMVARSSSYIGDYFLGEGDGDENIKVQENLDTEDLPTEPDFAEYPVIVHVNSTQRSDEIRPQLEGVGLKLLRHDVL